MSVFANAGQPQLLKYLYPNEAWRVLYTRNRPFLAMVPKGDSSTGSTATTSGIVHAFNYAGTQSGSIDYTSSVNQQDNLVLGQQFIIQLSQMYGTLRLNSKDIAASRNRMAAYMDSKKMNFDDVLKNLSFQLDLALHRAGNGIVGTIATGGVSGNVITLTSAASIQQFQVGQTYQACSTFPTDGTAPTLTGGVGKVTNVNVVINSNGLSTVSLTLTSTSGFSAGNGIALLGNAQGISSLNAAGGILGMGNWNPIVAPSSNDNFISSGLNRSVDVLRLAGLRIATGGMTIRETIQALAAQIHAMGGYPDVALLNPTDWQRANMELQNFARYEEFKVGEVAFKAIVVASPAGGDLRLMSDPNQDLGVLRILTMDTWKLWHMGELVHVVDEDGLTMRKDTGSDAFQIQFRSWPQLVCFEPFSNGVASI